MFSSVLFAGDDIVFYGIRVNEEGTFYYGAFEPQSKKMNVFAEKNFNCVRMRVSQKYVVFEKVCCIEEDRNPMKSSSGRLLGIDLQTKKNLKCSWMEKKIIWR